MTTKASEATFQPFATSPERVFTTLRGAPNFDKALIFLDTNVLLAPYRASTEALNAIKETYSKLRGDGRLIIPAQVAREFGRNRPQLLAQLHKLVRDSRSISINGHLEGVPILLNTAEYIEAQQHFSAMTEALKACRAAIDKAVRRIELWETTDPVLDVYRSLFDAEVVREMSLDPAAFESARKTRYEARMPPGFRDKGKEDGGGGDLAIWITILEVSTQSSRDAILVTEDSKDDWFHRSGDQRLFPRYELVEEFSQRTGGKSFGIATLSSLLVRYGVPKSVIQEVTEQERRYDGLPELGELHITVDPDGNQISVGVFHGRTLKQLPPSSSHRLLLLLAKARVSETHRPESERGWIHIDKLCDELNREPERLNIDIYRLRKQLGPAIVERRPGARDLRLGTDRVEVVRL